MEWISVKDQLPKGSKFLGYCPSQGIHCFELFEEYCVTGSWEECHYCGGQSRGVLPGQNEPQYHQEKITHWMPLPEPPKDNE